MRTLSKEASVTLSDSLAAAGGLLTVPVAWLVFSTGIFGINAGMTVLASIAALACCVSLISAVFLSAGAPVELASAAGARRGARVGLLSVLVGGGTMAAACTFLSLGLFGSTVVAAPAAIGVVAFVGMTVLPVLFASMTGGWIGGRIEASCRPVCDIAEVVEGQAGEGDAETSRWWKGALPYVLALAALLYASPFVSALVEESSVTETPPPPPPKAAPVSKPPLPPPYRYERPAGFREADSTRVVLVRHEVLSAVDSGSPMLVSPDGKFLALCRERPRTVDVIRLTDREVMARFEIDHVGADLAWAPDSKRLACFSIRGDERIVTVLEPESSSTIVLPIPSDTHLPSGARIGWPFANALIFLTSSTEDAYLDLDTLLVHPISELSAWSKLTEIERDSNYAAARGDVAGRGPWRLGVVERVVSYLPPNYFQKGWMHRASPAVAVIDRDFPCHHTIGDSRIPVEHDRVISTPDRSVWIVTRGSNAHFLYFGLRQEPLLSSSFELSRVFPGGYAEEELLRHLHANTLSAFVCAPLINPLNGRLVGPDRREVRGLARMGLAEDGQVDLWIAEEHEPIREGDVVADLHYWHKNEPQSLDTLGLPNWWRVLPLSEPPGSAIAFRRDWVPERSDAVAIAKPARNSDPAPDVPLVATRLTPAPVRQTEPVAVEDLIRAFVVDHHRKINRGDLQGLADDYAKEVEYFNRGKYAVEEIIEEQSFYKMKWSKVSETVRSEIQVGALGRDQYRVAYDLHSYLESAEEKRWLEAASRVDLRVTFSGTRPVIHFQNGEVRDTKKGELK